MSNEDLVIAVALMDIALVIAVIIITNICHPYCK